MLNEEEIKARNLESQKAYRITSRIPDVLKRMPNGIFEPQDNVKLVPKHHRPLEKISSEKFGPPEAVGAIPFLSGQIARSLMRQKDERIAAAITLAMKTAAWTPEEIAPRCSVQRCGKSVIIHLDEKPLIQFFEPEFKTANEDEQNKLFGAQYYKVLWQD